MTKILHISPHLGGGVGRVLLNYLSINKTNEKYFHEIICLDRINPNSKNILEENSLNYIENCYNNTELILNKISETDIVVIHWWNHPFLYDLLIRNELPPCRLIFWSHVSGESAPNIFTNTLFDYPDLFVFTTPMSYLNKKVLQYNDKSKFKDIWSTAGVEYTKNIIHKKHKDFIVGYIGTVDYAKMYPNFIKMCAKINIPNIKFIICGEGSSLDKMKKDVKNMGLDKKFIFTGYVEDITVYLSQFDVFGYPLNSAHYGTCDQVLAEAMSCGIVPVVFNNSMESYMVHNLYSGFVVPNEEEYIKKIFTLYQNKTLKYRLGENAKNEAKSKFSVKQTIDNWEKLFNQILNKDKTAKIWKKKYTKTLTSIDIFYESIGTFSILFKEHMNSPSKKSKERIEKAISDNNGWISKTKGSPFHYLDFLKDDKKLKQLCDEIKARSN